ncbi:MULTISPECIES: hypothetical protein [Lysinibacillus]|uniref:hypothetical protein n=1 Tax=Lysinibacillus TaxID=400634 RepID=UPI00381C9370
MSDRFELSFKNKEVRMWFVIMVPIFIAGILIAIFTEIQDLYITGSIPLIAWITYYIWRYLYRRKQKKESSIN